MPKDNIADQFPKDDERTDELVDRGDELDNELDDEDGEGDDEGKGKKSPAKKSTTKKSEKKDEDDESDDEDDESDDEDEDDEDDEEEEQTQKKGKLVALHVLKKSQDKRRAAEAKVRELEQRLQQQEETKSDRQKAQFDKMTARMDELYEQVEEARAEGRSKDAAKLQRELDDIKGQLTSAQSAMLATKQALAAQSTVAYNALVAELEAMDPRFDEDADDYDADLVERVGELTEAYEARGANAPDALRKALRLILGSDPFRDRARLARQPEKEKDKVPPRKTDVKKALDTKKKQPPEDREGNREKSSKIDATKLNDDDFDKLPASKKRELRGDFL